MIQLPIDSYLDDIVRTVSASARTILTAAPGTGKTTRLPPRLLECVPGRVAVLQPRRLAAVAACQRICDERKWSVGAEAGYQVRFESRVSASTRLIFMTEALLLRQMLEDPELKQVDLLVIDEFHERTLNQDLILGAVKELQEMGREIKLLVMSATLDTPRLSRFLGEVAVFDVPGVSFDLDLRHSNQSLSLRTDHAFHDRVTLAARAADRETDGDILIFLPGVGEIRRLSERLSEAGGRRAVFGLHGSMPLAEQQAVLKPSSVPRYILSTNVAEASVTVPGVNYVIDTGLARVMRTHFRTGFSKLDLERIALFNARQRAGRAARERDGVCLRLWTSHEEVTQSEAPDPEVQRVDLSQALLFLAHLGVADFGGFSWLDHPNGALLQMASRWLRETGALDREGRLTRQGARLLEFPLPPRWGAVLALAETRGASALGARAAAILSERDFVDAVRLREMRDFDESDLLFRMGLLDDKRSDLVHRRALESVLQVERQLLSMARKNSAKDPADLDELLLQTQLDRLCRRRGKTERALMVGGRGVKLAPTSQVRESEFFIALDGVDLGDQNETQISLASGLDKNSLLKYLGDRVEARSDVFYDEDRDQFYQRRSRFFKDLPLDEPVLTSVGAEQASEAMIQAMDERWSALVERNEALKHWFERSSFLHHYNKDFPADLSQDERRRFLEMACFGRTRMADVAAQDLVGLLEGAVGADRARTLREQAPAHFVAPTGSRLKIHYEESKSAYVEVRLQEMFGTPASPKLAFGKIALTFRLLAPNYRPVQVTSDLASFWRNGYVEVRKELRTRYPKHSWPDDPLTAPPVAKGRPRK